MFFFFLSLQEFTCDVSLEDTKKPQPLQFSFTLYDLDGHGKITKDDIAGIVSTIYESIGKSVVVPHYGSKTINVRLTVSPDSKTKPHVVNGKKTEKVQQRRRYRPRKLVSDEEDDNCSETSAETCQKNLKQKRDKNRLSKDCSTTTTVTTTTDSANENRDATTKTRVYFNDKVTNVAPQKHGDGIYETIHNLSKCCQNTNLKSEDHAQAECCLIDMSSCLNGDLGKNNDIDNCNVVCKECTMDPCPFDIAEQKLNKKKLLRKSRSRKQKNTNREDAKPRARSLSVGNENSWKMDNREEQQCWKSPLRRHELIEIIRESMEKNRLCFQTNR